MYLLFNMSGQEIFIILLFIVLFFGTDKLPEIARGIGKGIRQVKDATNDIKREITDSANSVSNPTDISSQVKKEVDKVKEDIEEITGPIKRRF